MDLVEHLLNLLLARCYEFTDHAIESLDEDNLTLNDVLSCLSTGRVRRSWKRQGKHEIEGQAVDGRPIRVVGRLIGRKRLRIITVYEVR